MKASTERADVRLLVWRGVVIFISLVMIARLWQLQMVEGETYRIRADRNRFRQVDIPAPRGVIYDRNGEILARNRPSFSVAVVPADLPKTRAGEPDADAERAVLDRLLALLAQEPPPLRPSPTPTASPTPAAGIAGRMQPTAAITTALQIQERQPWVMPRADIEKAIREGRLGGAYRPIEIARHINEATAFLVAQDAVNLPGVILQLNPIRDYPSGSLTSHLIGYMGHIPENAVAEYRAKGYAANEQVGLTGLEATYEHELRGKRGRQTIEVNVNGRRIGRCMHHTHARPARVGHGHKGRKWQLSYSRQSSLTIWS